jgi:hypothetical protein
MALTGCKECGGQFSTTAKACPQCGAKVPHTKWWLWIPLALLTAFLIFGFSIPEYESRAREVRNFCEKMAAGDPIAKKICDKKYHEIIEEGKRNERK